MMDPKISPRGKVWILRYDEYETISNDDGALSRVRREKTKSFATKAEAKARRDGILLAHAKGNAFVADQDRPVARIFDIARAYKDAAHTVPTARYRYSMYNKLEKHLGEKALVTEFSSDMLRRYAKFVEDDGCKRVDRFVGEVERMWKWAYERDYPGVPRPRKIVGQDVLVPRPVFPTDTPTFEDCDAMIRQLKGWPRQVAIVLRYTGIRASQALSLNREDYDLDRQVLWLRGEARGAKGARTRAIPLHAALVAELREWDLPAAGPIFLSRDVRRVKGPGLRDGKELGIALTGAWIAAGVSADKWGAPEDNPGGRTYARPVHCIRAAVLFQLDEQGVPPHISGYLIGHKTNATRAAYVPECQPGASPYWKAMVDAVARLPAMER